MPAEKISRMIAIFGRYPQKRPKGLNVDESGAFRVDELMESWGKAQGLTENDVVSAVRKFMFHDGDASCGALRYAICDDPEGRLLIRVLPKRRGGQQQWNQQQRHQQQKQQQSPSQQQQLPPWQQQEQQSSQSQPQRTTPLRAQQRKNDSWSQSSQWQNDGSCDSSNAWDSSNTESWQQDDSWNSSPWQRGSKSWQSGGGQWKRSNGEQVQRCLGFLLKSDDKENGVAVSSDGWAKLGDAVAFLQKRSDLGITGEQALRDLLQETDAAGRFEISSGYIRKVPREHRQPHQVSSSSVYVTSGTSDASQKAVQQSSQPAAGTGEAPEAPPGPNWTRFHDEGVLWWYYEGPHGKWWCTADDKKPQPFVDDDEE